MKLLPGIIATALQLLCLSSCSRPPATEEFRRVDQSVNGLYSFPVDMSDSLSLYTISFYTKLVGKKTVSVPLQVLWISPSGKMYSESVNMTAGDRKGDRAVYRSDIVPKEYGLWTLGIGSLNDIPGFLGIGVICENKPIGDGTRQTP